MSIEDVTSSVPSKRASSALQMAPQKKASTSDPILRLEQMEDTPLEDFSAEERREHHVFEQLLESHPGLLERLKNGSDEDIIHVGELGAAGARGDNMKTLKNLKIDRGFNHDLTGFLLCPVGLDWNDSQTKEVYEVANYGSVEINGQFLCTPIIPMTLKIRGTVSFGAVYWYALISMSSHLQALHCHFYRIYCDSGSICLELVLCILRTDTTTDSETFYHSLLDLLDDPDESKEVDELLTWWNRQVFPTSSAAK
ncbi:hypothetical protein F4604DRAFT_1938527 [Suillus subluteus]|nr:hypothetical protein F4604DRAFT_1938527 [Suillus subluteus]